VSRSPERDRDARITDARITNAPFLCPRLLRGRQRVLGSSFNRCRSSNEKELCIPPAKTARKATTKTSRRTTVRKSTRKAAKRPARRALTPSHKKALAEGRTLSATVNRYLAAVNTPKKRGRKVSAASLNSRLVAARTRLETSTGVDKALAAQEVRDLQSPARAGDYGEHGRREDSGSRLREGRKEVRREPGHHLRRWRDADVPAQVLKCAGVARTRG